MNTDKNVSKAAKSVGSERICVQNLVLEVPVMERPWKFQLWNGLGSSSYGTALEVPVMERPQYAKKFGHGSS
jgi:hypothetical protein